MATNPAIKRPHAESEYTPQSIQELIKCERDPIYFIENYVKVVDPVKGSVPMKLFEYQKDMIKSIHENKDTIILASRQMGKCVMHNTHVTTIVKPTGFRKFILKITDRELYDNLFRDQTANKNNYLKSQ